MARVSASTATKRTPRQVIAAKSVRKGTLPGEAPLHPMAKPTEALLVTALIDAGGFHRDALQLELAVGLSLFSTLTEGSKVDLAHKKNLRGIYEKAGYACKTPVGEDYKTVARRVGVTADLFQFIGGFETIKDWVEDAPMKQHVHIIMSHLQEYNFNGINSVLAHIGKPVAVKRPRHGKPAQAPVAQMSEADNLVAAQLLLHDKERLDAEAAGIPPGRIFKHGHMQVTIPRMMK
jgi:hypothetical protein